jgi:putative ABC transport system substrate-binding protein
MRRREFIAVLGGAAVVWVRFASAQKFDVPVVATLNSSRETSEYFWKVFRRDMQALGWEDNRNIRVIRRWPEKADEGMSELARNLIAEGATVIFAGAGDSAIRAAQKATSSLPIVGMSDDMVASGLVASLARPGSNTTGVSILASELNAKRLELLHELVPQARRIAILADPTTVSTRHQLESAARELNVELCFHAATNRDEIEAELANIAANRMGAVNILASPFLNAARGLLIERLAETAIPAIYQWPEASEEGGLMGYGPRITLCYRHVAILIDKILRGAKPADLPVEQPNILTLAINLRTAKRLGIIIPAGLLLRAGEVIE